MDRKNSAVKWYRLKDDMIVAILLMAFAFIINAGIEIRGLFMDDLYLWSCYGEQSFREFVFPIGSTRFRFVYYLAAYLQLALIGNHITWFVPCNIIVNGLIAYTVFCFGRKLAGNRVIGFCCGLVYLLSRMSYYQISQVYGLMESMALWMAIGILYSLYCYMNEKRGNQTFLWIADGLYFGICFVHERYMVLLPVILAAMLMKREKKAKNWLIPVALFALVQVIRMLTIGTISPAGTGGTDVADTFNLAQTIRFGIHQVLYMFGINPGDAYLSGIRWRDTARWVKMLVMIADAVLGLLGLAYVVKLVRDRKNLGRNLCNTLLFILFIGGCIACSSVTIRLEVRWVYVSMTAALLFLAYMCGAIMRPVQKDHENEQEKKAVFSLSRYHCVVACCAGVVLYTLLMFPVERYYRSYYPELYFWHNQERYNSLAEETYEKYGDGVFGKKIYILENTYEVSDFNASTFFKTFDPQRKAEGTEVIFVDSIRDFGQVTDNMLVLREEPEFHAYQDITSLVRELKCNSEYGYYGDGWMDESARIRVMAGSTGLIQLQFLYPGELTGEEISQIYQDDELVMEVPITQNITYVELQEEPYAMVELQFENNFYLKDALEQRGEERFSMMVQITAD